MKKEKIKRVFKENMKNFAVFIWFVLVAMCFYHEGERKKTVGIRKTV